MKLLGIFILSGTLDPLPRSVFVEIQDDFLKKITDSSIIVVLFIYSSEIYFHVVNTHIFNKIQIHVTL